MARAREEVIFGAAIDTTAFTRQANQMRQTAQQAGAAVSGTGAAFQQTQAKVISLGDKLKNFEPTVGKAASGVSGMAGAMGGLVNNTNAVSGAVAGLAGAFSGGGLLAVGIGAITLLVGGLAEEWGRAREEADKAREAQEDYAKTLSQLLESEIERLKDLKAKHRIIARFNNLKFSLPGEYAVEVLLNGELKVRFPLVVKKVIERTS